MAMRVVGSADWRVRFVVLHQGFGAWDDKLYDSLGVELRALWGVTKAMRGDNGKIHEKVAPKLRMLISGFVPEPGTPKSLEAILLSLRLSYNVSDDPGFGDLARREVTGRQKLLDMDTRKKEDRIAAVTARAYVEQAIRQFIPIIQSQLLAAGIITAEVEGGLKAHASIDNQENRPSVAATLELSRPEPTRANPLYARRDRIHAEFARLVSLGENRILLAGQPGMGKTCLAKELPKDFVSSNDVLFLNASTSDELTFNLVEAMNRYKIVSPVSSPTPEHLLAAVLSSRNSGPKFVILDNVELPTMLNSMVPGHINSTVIATCRTSVHLPSMWNVIPVSRMSDDEIDDLIQRALPKLAKLQRTKLVSHLDGYALVAKYAGVLLRHGGITADQFVERFRQDRRDVVAATPTDEGVRLLEVLKDVVELVRLQNADAADLLEGVGVLTDTVRFGEMPNGYLSGYLAAKNGRAQHDDIPSIRYLAALNVLREFGFIEHEELGCFQVHPMTAQMLANLAEANFALVATRLIRAHAAVLLTRKRDSSSQWYGYKSYGEAVGRHMGEKLTKEVAQDYMKKIMSRAARVPQKPKRRSLLQRLLGVHPLSASDFVPAVNAGRDIPWRLGRLAYNLIEGHGAPMRPFFSEYLNIGRSIPARRPLTLDEIRRKFAGEKVSLSREGLSSDLQERPSSE